MWFLLTRLVLMVVLSGVLYALSGRTTFNLVASLIFLFGIFLSIRALRSMATNNI